MQPFHPHLQYARTKKIALSLLIVLFAAGCVRPSTKEAPLRMPTSEMPLVFTTTPGGKAVQAGSATPGEIARVVPSETPANAETATAAASITPSPTPCAPPSGWIVYTVLPGDTLFSLARNTGTSVEAIQQANCLSDTLIIAYNEIHLPKRPPERPAAPPVQATSQPVPQPQPVDLCISIFSCSNPNLPALTISPGGSNFPTFQPCTSADSGARIDFEGLSVNPQLLTREVGIQTYFFACGFTDPTQLVAQLTGPDGVSQNLDVLDINRMPDRDQLDRSKAAQKVIPWYPVCNLPDGDYTLRLSSGSQVAPPLTLRVGQPKLQNIMVRPQSFKKGDKFDVFYCGYSRVAGQKVKVNLYQLTRTDPDGKRNFDHFRSWEVEINKDGWAQQEQTAPENTLANTYFIRDDPGDLEGFNLFWVIP
jgi:LysM repeat protein